MCIHNESMLEPRFICLHDALLLALILSLKTQKKILFLILGVKSVALSGGKVSVDQIDL